MMKLKNTLLLSTALILIVLLVVGCGNKQATSAPVEGNIVATQELELQPENPSSELSDSNRSPDDVPIMPEGYDLAVVNQLVVTYKVDFQSEDVLKYYQEELPTYGWEITKNPDTSVGTMSSMRRENSKGDKINATMQYNPMGEFTLVQIYLTRAP